MSPAARVALVVSSVTLLAASVACGGGTPSEPGSAGGTPLPAGQPADVGAWRAAQTWLVDQRPVIEPGEVQDANVWRVTLVRAASCSPATEVPAAPPAEPPAPPAEPPALPGEPTPTAEPSPTPGVSSLTGATHHCVLLRIENPATSPGVLDLGRDGPVLVTPDGSRLPVAGVRMETGPYAMATWAGRATSASTCSFSAPDAQGRQAADCAMMVVARSNGTTFEEALAVIGAGKTIELELAFQDPGAAGDAVLEWPGGVRFAAESTAIETPAPSAEAARPPTPAPPPTMPVASPLLPLTPNPTSTMPAAGPGSVSFSGSGTAQTEMRDLAGGDYTMTTDLQVPAGQYNCLAMVCLSNPMHAAIGSEVSCAIEYVTEDEGGHKTVTQELPGLDAGPYFVKSRAEDPSQACEWTVTLRPR